MPDTVNELNGAPPPIAPDSITAPLEPPVRVNVLPPLIVVEKVIPAPVGVLPPFVASTMRFAFKVTAPVIPMEPPLVVKWPPNPITPVYPIEPVVFTVELWVIALPLTLREASGAVFPIAPDSPTVLVPERLNVCAPLIVLEKERVEPLSATGPVKLTGPVIEMPLGVEELKLPPKLIVPAL